MRRGTDRPAVQLLFLLALCTPAARAQGGESFTAWAYPQTLNCPQLPFAPNTPAGSDVSDFIGSQSSSTQLPGVFFLAPGTYNVARSAAVRKPPIMQQGAVFRLAAGATLTLEQPLTAGAHKVFDGPGSVRFRAQGNILPEWFGALGNGVADDAPAIQRAFQAANDSGVEVLFSASKVYMVGTTLRKLHIMRIFSEPGATLRAVRPGMVGVLYPSGRHNRPDLLPRLEGFATGVEFDDTGMVDSSAPYIGPAPGRPCIEGLRVNAGSCRIKFGVIENCVTGVHVTTRTAVRTVMQGLAIEGEAFVDTTGQSKEVYLWTAANIANEPYWDHGLYVLKTVKPHPRAKGFAVVRSNLDSTSRSMGLPFHTYEIGSLGALPAGGKLLDTTLWNSVLRVNPVAPFADGQLDHTAGPPQGLNSLFFAGPAAQFTGTLTLSSTGNSLASFKAANKLAQTPWQNVLRVSTPGGAWTAGETRQLYLYHQLAFQAQLLYTNVAEWGSRCIDGKLAVTSLTDNSPTWKFTGVVYEVAVNVVACTDFTGPITFSLAIGTPSA